MYCLYNNILFFYISRFLDVANASSMPHLPRKIDSDDFAFYRSILSCPEAKKCVKFQFTIKIVNPQNFTSSLNSSEGRRNHFER